MPKPTGDELYLQEDARIFFQMNGPNRQNDLQFYGVNWQYAMLEGVTESFGSLTPMYKRDPYGKGWRLVAKSREAPDLPTATLTLNEKIGSVPRNLGTQCEFNLYVPVGACKVLSDPLNGWDYLKILSGASAESLDGGTIVTSDSSDALTDSYSLQLSAIYNIGQIRFGAVAAGQIDREVIDLVWAGTLECPGCGPGDTGAQRLYAVTVGSGAGSPGLPAEVIYVYFASDGSQTIYEYPLTFLSASEAPTFIDVMGSTLIVGSNAGGSIAYATIDPLTGQLGAFTEVLTGFVASRGPNDIYVANNYEAFIVGDGGYIYRMTIPALGVTVLNAGATTTQNLTRIHGYGNTIVAVGATASSTATILISNNNGRTWALAPSAPTTGTLNAVQVISGNNYWIGGASRWNTLNNGATWVEVPSNGAVTDILFVTNEIGYTLLTASGAAQIQATFDGGKNWASSTTTNSRIGQWPQTGFAQSGRVAAPINASVEESVGTLAVGGRVGAALTDGVLQVGFTQFL